MKNEQQHVSELLNERDAYLADHHNVLTDKQWMKLETLIEHNQMMAHKGLQSSTLTDLHSGRNPHHASIYNRYLYQPAMDNSEEDNINDINKLINPSDLPFFLEVLNTFYCTNTYLQPAQRMCFSAYCLIRLRNKTGKYHVFLFKIYQVLEDANGKPWIIKTENKLIRKCRDENFHPHRQFVLMYENSDCVEKILNPFYSAHLSNIQLMVLELAHSGKSVKETAEMLNITESNVNYHRTQVKEKLNVDTLPGAWTLAEEMKMITEDHVMIHDVVIHDVEMC